MKTAMQIALLLSLTLPMSGISDEGVKPWERNWVDPFDEPDIQPPNFKFDIPPPDFQRVPGRSHREEPRFDERLYHRCVLAHIQHTSSIYVARTIKNSCRKISYK